MRGKRSLSTAVCAWFAVTGTASVRAEFHTVRFVDPSGVPTGHLPDTGGILHPTSHNFQEDGVHVEAIWAPSTHVGFTQGHFHHVENGFETSHGFGNADAQGWYDLMGFYLRMVDGRPFTLMSIDYRLRVQLQNTDVLVTTTFAPTLPFTGQFVHFPVTRFSTFQTLTFSGFEDASEVFISSILNHPNNQQVQWDNIVLWTDPNVQGACCAAAGIGCSLETAEDCAAAGGSYVGDDTVCTGGAYCPTSAGACCSPDAAACTMTTQLDCQLPDGVFAGLGTACGVSPVCPMATGRCCIDNGAGCLQILGPACSGADTYFHGAGSNCTDPGECFVPCDIDADCDDSDTCNGDETCDLPTGTCVSGTALDCDDADACTLEVCDPLTGCGYSVVGCNDSDPCTVDACDVELGCTHTAIVCTDDDACNGMETCNTETGLCDVGADLDCDDNDICTTDSCDPVLGCENIPPDCDDADPCTDDSCDNGECVHAAVVCDDGNVCNGLESCNPTSGACDAGTALDCDDLDACTTDSCDAVTGCESVPVVCDDGDVCNGLETCNTGTGACDAGLLLDCDDLDACTTDSCDPITGCESTAVVCDDGDVCNGLETCNTGTGACDAGLVLDCDDLDACTTDSCDPITGCESTAVVCDDGDVCNGLETCNAGTGACDAGVLLDCDDLDACTTDSCDAVTGCGHTPVVCADGVACTIDTCDSIAGCLFTPDAAACSDGIFCNGVEICSALTGCEAGVDPCPGQNCDEALDVCVADQPSVWMAFAGDTVIPGVGTIRNEDVVAYDPDTATWSWVFDGSDVGLGSLAIDGLAVLPGGDLLLSFTAPGSVPGLIGGPNGLTVDGADLVRFTPTSLGATTAGTLSFYFDGSDVGLDTTSENVDALSIAADGRLIISTTANITAIGASGLDEDLFIFNATSLGAVTAGGFEMYFDGSDVGLDTTADEDVDAVALRPYGGGLLLSTVGAFSVTGVSGADEDALAFTPTQLGDTTAGTYQMLLDLSALGIDPAAALVALEEVP